MPPKVDTFSSSIAVAQPPKQNMESVNPAGLESLEGIDARQLKALIRERLELKGEPDATPKLVRRYIEQQQHLQRGALDPIRKLVNKVFIVDFQHIIQELIREK